MASAGGAQPSRGLGSLPCGEVAGARPLLSAALQQLLQHMPLHDALVTLWPELPTLPRAEALTAVWWGQRVAAQINDRGAAAGR